MLAALLGIVVLLLTIVAILKKVEVRLAMAVGALVLGLLAGRPDQIVLTFLKELAHEAFILPICSAMAFGFVLKKTGCDLHLVHLLVAPLRKARFFLVPGAVITGFLVNIPMISQAGTAVTLGPVLIPLLRAAGLPALTIGAAMLLGMSIGGELLNPGSPENQIVSNSLQMPATVYVGYVSRPLLLHLVVTTLVFWLLDSRRKDPATAEAAQSETGEFKVNFLKALVPILPLVFLFLVNPPLELIPLNKSWLLAEGEKPTAANPRLIALAMLLGTAAAMFLHPRQGSTLVVSFFEGAGHAYATVISLIVCAVSFGKGIELLDYPSYLKEIVVDYPFLFLPLGMGIPFLFAIACGSGIAATQSLFPFFVEPARVLGLEFPQVAPLISLGASSGRTASPFAAVNLVTSQLTGCDSWSLAKKTLAPLLAGLGTVYLFRLAGWV
ncbi:MAG: hypothetical protein EXR99_09110 [Gemmataceae bacterium]|nr:hypothetical protein [Gemmataceae bacterium]